MRDLARLDHVVLFFNGIAIRGSQVDVETERATTFQEMREKSIKCAIHMKKIGIKKGDMVVVCTHNYIDAYIPYLACLYNGIIVDLWHEDYVKSRNVTIFLLQ